MTPYLLTAAGMFITGLVFIYIVLRGSRRRRPEGALEWTAVSLSSAVVVSAVVLIAVTVSSADGTGVTPAADTMLQADASVPEVDPSELNRPAPDFAFRLVENDQEQTLEGLKGNVVLLNFWATWCAPCRMEMPELNRIQDAYGDRGLVVLTVSDEPRQELVAYSDENVMATLSGYLPDPSLLPDPFSRTLEVRPTTYVIDRDGVLRSYMFGAGTFEVFEDAITPFL